MRILKILILLLSLVGLTTCNNNEKPTKMVPYFSGNAPVPPPNYPDPATEPSEVKKDSTKSKSDSLEIK